MAPESFPAGTDGTPPEFVPFDTRSGRALYVRCYEDAWRTAHGSLSGFDEEACWHSALQRAGDSVDALLEMRVGGRFAGLLSLDERRGGYRRLGWIAFVYVIPELRGRGYGRALLARAEDRFASLRRRAVRLTVAPENPAAAFYKQIGYVCVGTERGALDDLYVMEKLL